MIKIFFIFLILSFKVMALEVPTLTGPIVDNAQVLGPEARVAMEEALLNLNQNEGVQFQVLIIKALEDESIEGYSIKVVDQWKIGKKGDDRGALFLIAIDDHKMRIEVGRGLEGTLTDLT